MPSNRLQRCNFCVKKCFFFLETIEEAGGGGGAKVITLSRTNDGIKSADRLGGCAISVHHLYLVILLIFLPLRSVQ